jgi:hypothetical protein
MEWRLTVRIGTGTVLLAALLLTCICQTCVAAGSSVSVSPQTVTVSPGDTFTVDIIVDPDYNEVYGAQCKLYFDGTLLKATNQTEGTFLSHDGADTIAILNGIDNTAGTIEYGETRTGDPAIIGGVIDSGVLTSITFEAIGSERCDLRLDALLADSSAHQIDAVINGGTCNVEGAGKGRFKKNSTPGFGVVYSVSGLIAVLLILRRFE